MTNVNFTTGFFSTSVILGRRVSLDSRLRDWLDPTGTDVDTLDGMEQPLLGSGVVSGMDGD